MITLLFTGGAGFIGANFVLHWWRLRPVDRIVVFDAWRPIQSGAYRAWVKRQYGTAS